MSATPDGEIGLAELRSPPQFSLRSLLIVMAAFAAFFAPYRFLGGGTLLLWGLIVFGATRVVFFYTSAPRRNAESTDDDTNTEPTHRDPRCVFVANDFGTAHIVVAWLDQQGIAAWVTNEATLGGIPGLTPFSTSGVSIDGVEVWVIKPEQAAAARALLANHAQQILSTKAAKSHARGDVECFCEECGHASTFAARYAGTVQECPKCYAYVDVPNAD